MPLPPSLRDTSSANSCTLSTLEYHDNSGNRVRGYLDPLRALGPLAFTHVVVEVGDTRGDLGANFLVR